MTMRWRYQPMALWDQPYEVVETPEYVYYVTKSLSRNLYVWWSTGHQEVHEWSPDGGNYVVTKPHGYIVADLRAKPRWFTDSRADFGKVRLNWQPPEKRWYEVSVREAEFRDFEFPLRAVPEVGGKEVLSYEGHPYETAIYLAIGCFEASLKAWETEALLMRDTSL